MYCVFFFFNDTSTTEFYTYSHTLSLHDALPISRTAAEHPSGQCQQAASRLLATRRCSVLHQHGRACRLPPDRPATPAPFACTAIARLPDDAWQSHDTTPDNVRTPKRWRSEEHTSELQSLMRISYAVFCLKKKNTKLTRNTY